MCPPIGDLGKLLVGATGCPRGAGAAPTCSTSSSRRRARGARRTSRSVRGGIILQPPCVLDGTSVDAAAAAKILDRFPSFEKIHETARNDGQSAAGFAAVEGALLKVDKQAPAALRWIMTSNKAHFVAFPPNMRLLERIAPEATCRQFIMLSQPPARQARFAALKARHGSKFAWHGSPAENWHCILRSGLRSASGTKFQLHGAAHGAGVYVSTPRRTLSDTPCRRGASTAAAPPEPATPQFNASFFGSPDLRIIGCARSPEVPRHHQKLEYLGGARRGRGRDAVPVRVSGRGPAGARRGGREHAGAGLRPGGARASTR